jgi:hypothetical protein
VRRINDAYLGRITEEEGLIPPKDKVTKPVRSYEYGLSSLIFSLCGNIHRGLRKTFVVHGDFIFIASILSFVYGSFTKELFEHSWLSLNYPDPDIPQTPTKAQESGLERGTRMINDTMCRHFGPELNTVMAYFSCVRLVLINDKLYCSSIPDSVISSVQKFKLDWRPDLWQK